MTLCRPLVVFSTILLLAGSEWAVAQRGPQPLGGPIPASIIPRETKNSRVELKYGAELPLETRFLDSRGEAVQLGDFFRSRRPVLLTLNYSRCPRQCSMQLDQLVDRLHKLDPAIGTDFDVLTVSIDPSEPPSLAAKARSKYTGPIAKRHSKESWAFLVGRGEAIRKLTESVGFFFEFLPRQNIFVHPSVNIVCTPDGRVSSYLPAWSQIDLLERAIAAAGEGNTFRLNIVQKGEKSDGGYSITDCVVFDPNRTAGAAKAMRVMKIGGVLMILFLAVLFPTLGAAARKRALAAENQNTADNREMT